MARGQVPSAQRLGTSPMGVGRAACIQTSGKGGRFALEQAPFPGFPLSTHVGSPGMQGGRQRCPRLPAGAPAPGVPACPQRDKAGGDGGDGEGAAQRQQPGWGAAASLPAHRPLRPFAFAGSVPLAPGRGRQGQHSPLAVLQADCGSPVWSARGSSFDAVYCAEMAHGKPDSARRGLGSRGGARGPPRPEALGQAARHPRNATVSPSLPRPGYAADQSSALSSLDCLSSIVDRLSPAEEPGLSLRDADSLSPSASTDSGPETPGTPLPRRTYQAL